MITKIAPQADPQTRTFLTELTLPNPQLPDGQRLLRSGMIVTVHVGTENDRRVTLLPMAAVHRGSSPGELMVYEAIMENDREIVKAKKVSLGGVYNNQVEVLTDSSEVGPGARIVVTTAERLTDGLAVSVTKYNPTSVATLPEAK